jgi:two-component sensor histidine kinase
MQNEYRTVEINITPGYSSGGKFIGLIGVITDVTNRDRAEARHNLLMAELGHRVKNIFAVVLSIAHRTLRSASSLDDARQEFEGRLISLARAQNVLISKGSDCASLNKLVAEGFAAHGIDRKRGSASGPDVMLPPAHALSLALVLHELCTNALKYGALSNDRGAIYLAWTVSAEKLQIIWAERGGPPVAASSHRGFGSILIERALSDVDAEFSGEYESGGLVCRIAMTVAPEKMETA